MAQTFDAKPSRPYRALQIWQILISKAANRQVATYEELKKILGYKGAGVFAQTLGHIMYYCDQNGLPPLTALVVKKDKGVPGTGLTTPKDLNAQREEVFPYKWFRDIQPTPEELKQAYAKGQSSQKL